MLFLALVACFPTTQPPVAPISAGTPEGTAPAAPPPGAPSEDLACGGRPGCANAESWEGRPGERFVRVELPRNEEDNCAPGEVWRLQGEKKTLLAAYCNDGYGASGVGEDSFSFEAGTFTWSRYGGSAWRWGSAIKAELDPPRVISYDTSSSWMAEIESSQQVDLVAWSARGDRSYPQCGTEGGENATLLAAGWVGIPAVERPEGATFATTRLGGCSATIDGRASGPTTWGAASTPADASFKAAILGNELWVEVTDDLIVSGAAKWIFDDHLEIWWEDTANQMHCIEKTSGKQWGIRLSDGQVFPAEGKPDPLTAEVLKIDDQHVQIRVVLPKAPDSDNDWITVVYSDSDDGKTQERMIASSAVEHAKSWTLGAIWRPRPGCQVQAGRLEPLQRAIPGNDKPGEPVFSLD